MSLKSQHGLGVMLVLGMMAASARAQVKSESPAASEEIPVGWAAAAGGTTGGQGGLTVDVSDASGLVSQAESRTRNAR